MPEKSIVLSLNSGHIKEKGTDRAHETTYLGP